MQCKRRGWLGVELLGKKLRHMLASLRRQTIVLCDIIFHIFVLISIIYVYIYTRSYTMRAVYKGVDAEGCG